MKSGTFSRVQWGVWPGLLLLVGLAPTPVLAGQAVSALLGGQGTDRSDLVFQFRRGWWQRATSESAEE